MSIYCILLQLISKDSVLKRNEPQGKIKYLHQLSSSCVKSTGLSLEPPEMRLSSFALLLAVGLAGSNFIFFPDDGSGLWTSLSRLRLPLRDPSDLAGDDGSVSLGSSSMWTGECSLDPGADGTPSATGVVLRRKPGKRGSGERSYVTFVSDSTSSAKTGWYGRSGIDTPRMETVLGALEGARGRDGRRDGARDKVDACDGARGKEDGRDGAAERGASVGLAGNEDIGTDGCRSVVDEDDGLVFSNKATSCRSDLTIGGIAVI